VDVEERRSRDFPLFRSLAAQMTTLHGPQDLGDLELFYSHFGEMPLISISTSHCRTPILSRQFTTAFRPICFGHRLSRGATSPSWGAFRLKSAQTVRLE